MELKASREGPGGKVLGQRQAGWFSGDFRRMLEAGDMSQFYSQAQEVSDKVGGISRTDPSTTASSQ